MTLDDVIKIVAQLGFPAFVAAVLLVRFDVLLRQLIMTEQREYELLTEMRDELREFRHKQ